MGSRWPRVTDISADCLARILLSASDAFVIPAGRFPKDLVLVAPPDCLHSSLAQMIDCDRVGRGAQADPLGYASEVGYR